MSPDMVIYVFYLIQERVRITLADGTYLVRVPRLQAGKDQV